MEEVHSRPERYDSLDGLRGFSSIGILVMHVLINGRYELGGFLFQRMILSFTDLVYLFMMLSGFSMCCGYFEPMVNGAITPERFYSKRISKIWPFFALVTLLDLAVSPSLNAVYEAFANLTLCFGLLPNAKISVIGVGWTLGVIFVFYLLFPFCCYLLSNRKRGWIAFAVALIYNILCSRYFFDAAHMPEGFSGRVNILYCAVYFVAGGMIFSYRKELAKLPRWGRYLLLVVIVVEVAWYFKFGKNTVLLVTMFSLMLIYAVGRGTEAGLLNNPVARFFSKISMELYLCHMIVYRVLEKMKVTSLFSSSVLGFCVTVVLTMGGAVAFSVGAQWGIRKVTQWCGNRTDAGWRLEKH